MKEFLKKVMLFLLGVAAGTGTGAMVNYQAIFREKDEQLTREQLKSARNLSIVEVFAQWLQIKQDGKTLVDYFETKGYYKVAIYGMHYLGKALLRELEGTSIKVVYAIDRNAKNISCNVPRFDMKGSLGEADVIVVTPITSFFEIEDELCKRINCPIISIEDVIFDMQ